MSDNVPTDEVLPSVAEEPRAESNVAAVTSISDLKPKMELKGVVKRIELFGAFVDVGVGHDGLLHISQLREEPVNNVADVLKEGDEITVWVRKVDVNQNRIDLTLIKPLGLMWNEISVGQVVSGTVVRVEKFGAFVDIGAERPGMVHVSELSSGYINSPDDVVKVGDQVQAKVIKVNSRKKQIDLSIKALEAVPVAEKGGASSDDDEKVPTAFELALRRALLNSDEEFPALQRAFDSVDREGKSKKSKREKRQAGNEKHRQQQEELLSRTLKTREGAR